jgi:hypothetical protein
LYIAAILGSGESRQEKQEEEEVEGDDAASDVSDLVSRPMDVTNLKTRAFVVNTRDVIVCVNPFDTSASKLYMQSNG